MNGITLGEFYSERKHMWCPICAASCPATFNPAKRVHLIACDKCNAIYTVGYEMPMDEKETLYTPPNIDDLAESIAKWRNGQKEERE